MPVRPATADDVDAIVRVAERSWAVDYPDILTRETAEEAANEWYDADRIAAELDADRTSLLVATAEESVVGFAHATWNDDRGYILRIYVHPDRRGEAFGRELLEATRETLESKRVERIDAMVLAANGPGNAFYERFGFEQVDDSETRVGDEHYRENRYTLDF